MTDKKLLDKLGKLVSDGKVSDVSISFENEGCGSSQFCVTDDKGWPWCYGQTIRDALEQFIDAAGAHRSGGDARFRQEDSWESTNVRVEDGVLQVGTERVLLTPRMKTFLQENI